MKVPVEALALAAAATEAFEAEAAATEKAASAALETPPPAADAAAEGTRGATADAAAEACADATAEGTGAMIAVGTVRVDVDENGGAGYWPLRRPLPLNAHLSPRRCEVVASLLAKHKPLAAAGYDLGLGRALR